MKDLSKIKFWLFDLDNTLYDGATKVFDQVDKKMSKFISEKLNVSIDEARKIQKFSVNMVEILNKYGGGVRAGKAIMKIIGIDCGPSRAPVKIFSSSEINSLISDLQSVGFI